MTEKTRMPRTKKSDVALDKEDDVFGAAENNTASDSELNAKISAKNLRVFVLTHSHPKLTRGGAEIAAESLFLGLQKQYDAKAWFIGCSGKSFTDRLGANFSQPFASNDYVYQTSHTFDWFKFANRDAKFPKAFEEMLKENRPNIVHFHHYAQFGVEALSIVKRVLPEAKVVLTLHEFLAICNNFGQMVKTETYRLCEEDSTMACASCFPHIEARDFFLRKRYIQSFFADVDLFISPSHFLAKRYIDWGVPEHKMRVIENVPPTNNNPHAGESILAAQAALFNKSDTAKEVVVKKHMTRIGFFGQMSPLKGIITLLDAAKELAEWEIENLSIELYGDYSNQPLDFQEAVVGKLDDLDSNARYHGPYENKMVHKLMQSVDAVVVPSVWWENSPVVIQEALTNGRPVICSNIGGMAEKVRPGLDGLWFDAGDTMSLAYLLRDIAERPDVLERLKLTVAKPQSIAEVLDAHLEAYMSA